MMITGLWECVSTEQSVIDFWRPYHIIMITRTSCSECIILRREIVLTMKMSVICARIIDSRHEYCAMKNKRTR